MGELADKAREVIEQLSEPVEREQIHGSYPNNGITWAELRSAYIAGYLRANKERE